MPDVILHGGPRPSLKIVNSCFWMLLNEDDYDGSNDDVLEDALTDESSDDENWEYDEQNDLLNADKQLHNLLC